MFSKKTKCSVESIVKNPIFDTSLQQLRQKLDMTTSTRWHCSKSRSSPTGTRL